MVVTTTAPHGLISGAQITITGVVGNTNANGAFTVNVLSPTTFQITPIGSATPVAGNANYVSGGAWRAIINGTIAGATNTSPITITTNTWIRMASPMPGCTA